MKNRHWIALLLVLGVAGAVGWGLLMSGRPAAPGGASDVSEDTGEHVVVQLLRDAKPVPAFSVTDLSGRSMSSDEWRGKVVLVNFWATWCGPCRAEIPDLVRLQEKYRDHLVIVGVSEDEGPIDMVQRFADEHHVNYPIVMTTPELQRIFTGIVALPTTFTIDPDGLLVQKHVGLLNARHTEAVTRALAGLEVNAKIERVEDPGRLTAEGIAQLKAVPGVDLAGLSSERKAAALQALNGEKCSCGCDLSVAKCRVDDPSCPVSLPIAQTIVARFSGAPAR
jgi:thiol-disulfide isomerase/thioredoxin